jgi:CRISP-associated protein Cas1
MRMYITTQGARLVKEGRHLLVKKEQDTYHTLFVKKIEQLLIFGNVEITAPARALLLRSGIDTVFLTRDGRFLGRFEHPEPKNIFLRIQQFRLLDDEKFALAFCRQVVEGKLRNMMTLLQRMKRTRKIKNQALRLGK